ncbi:hypothetical protein AURDEDRAFT_113089 [Auricularia subglabra TFB-10046 SS5]|nr:hypothetical protein AURDEDRAFT_113089 [Auricularia subglabra TFB-10046 SS5]
MSTVPFISQLKSLWQAVTGDAAGAKKTQEEFLDAWVHHPGQQISDLADNVPIVGHVKGLVHLALGDTEAFARSEEAATRTLAVLGAGALVAGTGGAAAPILAGVAAGVVADAAITGIESARHQKYDPQGYLGAISELSSDWRGGVFDVVALGVGDAVLGADGSVSKMKYKTTKVYRVEGEGIFLTKRGMVQRGANSRLFAGPGGTVIESPNILKLIVPPEEEEKPVKFKPPAVLCLNVGDASRAETYYAQKLLQYREAAEKVNSNPETPSVSHPTTFQFKIKSFRILTNDAKRMLRDIPHDGEPSPAGVRRVDITKTSVSFECPQPVYAPLIEKAIPDTFKEAQPAWLVHLPTRLLEWMRDHQVAYGRVRTFVIVASRFSKTSLRANIAQKITDNEMKRLEHGPISLSALSEEGINSIEMREEPVRRLRQSREVKCGRTLAGDTDHGRHMEYLAEFSDESTAWIPSRNVALDLKNEFWNVMTTDAKEVSEVVSADPGAGTVTVKRPDGSTERIPQEQLFWQQETGAPPQLTDAELDALLHHAHFGLSFDEILPCTLDVNTDWVRMEIQGNGAALKQDPAAEKAGEYADMQLDSRSIRMGREGSRNFVSRKIPFFVANNGAAFNIKVNHGRDATWLGDQRGRVALNLPDERFEAGFKASDSDQNTSTFEIRPLITTAGLLTVETDWGAIQLTSQNATIWMDPTVAESVYKNVAFSPTSAPTSMKLTTGAFGQKFVIPFIVASREEKVDLTITHGRDKSTYQDKLGGASALFAQNTYTSPYNPGQIDLNPKSFKNCNLTKRAPPVPL